VLLHDTAYVDALPPRKRLLLARLAELPRETSTDLAGSHWPVTIVGAGPAGAAAAIVLRRRGCPVLLLDRRPPPREKVCGDGLILDSHEALAALGVADRVRELGHAVQAGRIVSPSRSTATITSDFTTLERHFLDGLLLREAIDLGATFRLAHVRSTETRDDGSVAVHVDGGPAPIRTSCLIVASGATEQTWWSARRPEASAVAVRCYIHTRAARDEMLMVFSKTVPNGYGWVFPLGDGIYNVGVIQFRTEHAAPKGLRAMFGAFVEREPIVRDLWAGSRQLSGLKGAPLRCGLDLGATTPQPQSMAAGECIATTFPFTGEGIGKALQSGIVAGEQAAQALERGDTAAVARYGTRIRTELRASYEGYALAQKWLRRPWMYDLLVRRIDKSPYLRTMATGILTGSSSPGQMFSASSVLRSFLQ
jgi:flavin-dependent dehydrogenase